MSDARLGGDWSGESEDHLDTLAVRAAMGGDPRTGSVQPPVYQTSTYEQSGFAEHTGYEYARTQNPTREALEQAVAALESPREVASGVAFSSGMAAISTCVQLLQAGDHVLCVDDVYGGTWRYLMQVMDRFGISTTFSAFENGGQTLDELCRDETRMLIIETPTNPLLSIHDITELSAAAKARGILVLVDNTFATPLLQRPLDLGADIVIHSTTKYIGGHSDLIGGMAVVRDSKLAERLRFLQNAVGAIPGPWDCFLTLRGLRTLAVRMERHCSNATLLADRLADHPRVLELLYPGLQTHPGHAVAAQQMGGQFGGMLSLQVEGGAAGARRFVAELRHFTLAESLGGVESLVNHPLTMTHASMPEEDRLARGFSAGLLRLSVGIEHPEDLWKDIERALSA